MTQLLYDNAIIYDGKFVLPEHWPQTATIHHPSQEFTLYLKNVGHHDAGIFVIIYCKYS
jgi:hypothetical protein